MENVYIWGNLLFGFAGIHFLSQPQNGGQGDSFSHKKTVQERPAYKTMAEAVDVPIGIHSGVYHEYI